MRKELEDMLNDLDINNSWSSESTKIPYLAHVIQLVVKAILGAFDTRGHEGLRGRLRSFFFFFFFLFFFFFMGVPPKPPSPLRGMWT